MGAMAQERDKIPGNMGPAGRLLRGVKHLRNSTHRAIRDQISHWSRSREIVRAAKLSGEASLCRPDFVMIGAPKCGTSWLRGLLGQHPQLFMVPDEIEFFSSYLDHPLDWYAGHFAPERLTNGERELPPGSVVGEKSASYCAMSVDRIKLAHSFMPEAKLILMIRDPVARHWSHAKQYFSKTSHPERTPMSEISRRALFAFFKRTQRFGEFSIMLRNWETYFPPRHVLVLAQQQALQDPRGTLNRVLEHVGATDAYNPDQLKLLTRRKNVGPSMPMPDDVRRFLEDMFGPERERLKKQLGEGIFEAPAPTDGALAASR